MIKTVLFDLDGTLLNRDTSVQQFVAAQHHRLSFALGHISQADYLARWIELDCHGHVWKDVVYQQLAVEFEITRITWQDLLFDYETQFKSHCVPFTGMKEMLSALKQQDFSLGIITNGRGAFQLSSIDGLEIRDFFEAILISETEQMRKPDPEIFHRALDRTNSTAYESVFVGDNAEADVRGAKGAGLKAIWKRNAFCREPQNADAVIDSLEELPAILRGWA